MFNQWLSRTATRIARSGALGRFHGGNAKQGFSLCVVRLFSFIYLLGSSVKLASACGKSVPTDPVDKGRPWRPDTVLGRNNLISEIGEKGIGYCLDKDGPLLLLQEGLSGFSPKSSECIEIRKLLSLTICRLKDGSQEVVDHNCVLEIEAQLSKLYEISKSKTLSLQQNFAVAVCYAANRGKMIDASVFVLLTRGVSVFEKVRRMRDAMSRWGIEDEAFLERFPKAH